MRDLLSFEFRKMFRCRTLLWAILAGTAIAFVNVVENYALAQWFYSTQDMFYTPGYMALSIFAAWIDGSQETTGETIFFTVFPLLAAMPYACSLQSEKNTGYTNQILTRASRRQYLFAKYVAVFVSGGVAVVTAMILNFMANAWILPLCMTDPIVVGGGDGMFLSRLLFSKPMIYVCLCLVTCFLWAGTMACIALTAGLFVHRAIVIVLFPFALFLGSSFLIKSFAAGQVTAGNIDFLGALTKDPMQLLHAMTYDSNPAWYVWSILFGLFMVTSAVYVLRSRKVETL